ncbi:MAG TPA: type II toxin-antitoxin system PemK/MazF family toxin [Pyrinomonadaceae bacterium]|nr:type II toxin-antitoxin system PemK/MazF family toxin [Pyrinomonadaceae bacterium]
MVIKRFEIYWVSLNPTVGREMQKTRPAVVISPDEMNGALGTVIVAPITSNRRNFPTRVAFDNSGKENYLALDHLRAVDKSRLVKKISELSDETAQELCNRLQELFAY